MDTQLTAHQLRARQSSPNRGDRFTDVMLHEGRVFHAGAWDGDL